MYLWVPRGAKSSGKDDIWFRNPIHGMGSLWWVAVWSVFFFTLESADTAPPDAQRKFEMLFPERISSGRYGFHSVETRSDFLYLVRSFPPFNYAIANPLDRWMVSIITSYKKYERGYPVDLNETAFL